MIKRDSIVLKRPGTGLPSMMIEKVVGRVLKKDLIADTILDQETSRIILMSTAVIVQAKMGSRGLPGKSIIKLGDYKVIECAGLF